MKKVLAVSAFAVLGVAALSSCVKDYTCTCTYTYNGSTTTNTTTLTGKKADAKASCENGSNTYSVCTLN